MATDLYMEFVRRQAEIVQGNLPKFTTLIITHDDGAGCAVFCTLDEAVEAGQSILDSYKGQQGFDEDYIADMKTQLNEKGWVHIEDLVASKLYVVEGRLTQVENAPSNL